MKRLTQWVARARGLWGRLVHSTLRIARRRQAVHVLVTGTDIEALRIVRDAIREQLPILGARLVGANALHTLNDFGLVVANCHIDDITDAHQIHQGLRGLRRLVVVAAVADPRTSVCATDPLCPGDYADSFDYRLVSGADGLRTFTGPGVLPRWQGLDEWRGLPDVTVLEWPIEAFLSAPHRYVHELSQVATLPINPSAAKSIAEVASPSWMESSQSKKRVALLSSIAPGLEERSRAEGYPARAARRAAKPGSDRGTIIAFHTPDPVYRAEAERLKSTLDALGLEHRFYEISPETNWVRTTLLKPSWIIPARDELSGPLLYLDVDAFVHHDPWPYLSQFHGDLGAVVYANGQLNSATLWINDTQGARDLLAEWKAAADQRREADHGSLEATGDNGDQGVLKNVVLVDEARTTRRFLVHRLPVNLAYIFDRTDTYCVGPVMIEQLQVSRESAGHQQRLARRRARLQELGAGEVAPH